MSIKPVQNHASLSWWTPVKAYAVVTFVSGAAYVNSLDPLLYKNKEEALQYYSRGKLLLLKSIRISSLSSFAGAQVYWCYLVWQNTNGKNASP